MTFIYITATVLLLVTISFIVRKSSLKLLKQQPLEDNFCIIDIRDYISSHRSPYPGAENIPLSYLQRELRDRMKCRKEILLVTDDLRGAKIAAKIIRKKQKQAIYYIQT
ncbi:rhodanese-like domain-containing protein [Halobacillus locisalis]|uniref:Rhodanese-like domain-containing protein n=1 Tax=Halobacillus locisalis TaxID=220753 RepID=A0A838CV09_9BACI|nr:rhodanese-like domain-containing protein [Halobacillus locisalis]MBA2175810.1 rhodanese-like domain-containing protein [Halobacillus locisalis]